MNIEGPRDAIVKIDNLLETTNPEMVWDVLSIDGGPVVDLYLPRDPSGLGRLPYGFVSYESREVAMKAIQIFTDMKLNFGGRRVMLELYTPPPEPPKFHLSLEGKDIVFTEDDVMQSIEEVKHLQRKARKMLEVINSSMNN